MQTLRFTLDDLYTVHSRFEPDPNENPIPETVEKAYRDALDAFRRCRAIIESLKDNIYEHQGRLNRSGRPCPTHARCGTDLIVASQVIQKAMHCLEAGRRQVNADHDGLVEIEGD